MHYRGFGMRPACDHVSIETDDVGIVIRCNMPELFKECRPIGYRAACSPDIPGFLRI
jgi:hypothetical protein